MSSVTQYYTSTSHRVDSDAISVSYYIKCVSQQHLCIYLIRSCKCITFRRKDVILHASSVAEMFAMCRCSRNNLHNKTLNDIFVCFVSNVMPICCVSLLLQLLMRTLKEYRGKKRSFEQTK